MWTNFEPERLAQRGFAISQHRACKVDYQSALRFLFAFCFLFLFSAAWAQDFEPPPGGEGGFGGGPGRFGGGPGGPGGPTGGVQERKKLVATFDKNGDKRLDAQERQAAREYLKTQKSDRRGGPRFGPRGPRGAESRLPPSPGPKLSPGDVKTIPGVSLYDEKTLRTLFLQFENSDWEKELTAFYHTDVEVPANLTMDGKTYTEVGVSFRGASSFFMVSEGRKRSLTLSLDFVKSDQRVGGYHTLHLLNSHEDPTFMRSVLFYHIAREYIPAPQANYMRVVINGESWGVYINQQSFNKDFLKDCFGSSKGARWKVPGSPNGHAGLGYLGEEIAPYKKLYELKSKEDTNSWAALIRLCRVLNQTPPDQLEATLAPLLDIDATLKYLALDNVFVNGDGYWARASDYNLFLDEKGKFHLIPHDDNETFSLPPPQGGPGMGRGARVKGGELDPFAGAEDSKKPLLQKLLAVPALRARYSTFVRALSEKWLDWKRIAPLVEQYQALIAADVKSDTRKNDSFEAFTKGVAEEGQATVIQGPRAALSLKQFVEQRRAFLTSTPALKAAGKGNN